jgi:hypothetical protein
MKYKIWFDEENRLVRAQGFQALTKEEVEQLMSELKEVLIEKGVRLGIMDLSRMEAYRDLSKDVREAYKEHAKRLPLDKAAIIVSSPVVRMIAKIIVSSLKLSMTTRFYTSEQEAIHWLKDED